MIQAGLFFIVPLFLSVVLGLSPMATGVRLLPLSLSLLLAAVGIPKLVPNANPRRVARIGMLALMAGILVLIGSLEVGADSSIVFIPMLIIGFGIGALASQLGNVTVSSVPNEKSSEVGGLQNTASQLGASIGTALAGSILIAALTTSFLAGIEANPNVPQQMKDQANVSLAAGAPFISDSEAEAQLEEAGVPADVQDDILTEYEDSQIAGLRTALAILALMGVIALFFTGRIPEESAGVAAGAGRGPARSRLPAPARSRSRSQGGAVPAAADSAAGAGASARLLT